MLFYLYLFIPQPKYHCPSKWNPTKIRHVISFQLIRRVISMLWDSICFLLTPTEFCVLSIWTCGTSNTCGTCAAFVSSMDQLWRYIFLEVVISRVIELSGTIKRRKRVCLFSFVLMHHLLLHNPGYLIGGVLFQRWKVLGISWRKLDQTKLLSSLWY